MKVYRALLVINVMIAVFVIAQIGYYTLIIGSEDNLTMYMVILIACIVDVSWSLFHIVKKD